MRKRIVILVLLIVTAGVLSGCMTDNQDMKPSDGEQTPTETETPEPQENTTDSPEENESSDETDSVPVEAFSEDKIRQQLYTEVNAYRENNSVSPLATDWTTTEMVQTMAQSHSQSMAYYGKAAHTLDGNSTTARYKIHDLYNRCGFKSTEGSYIIKPDERLEVLGHVALDSSSTSTNDAYMNEDEIAKSLLTKWDSNSDYSERLLYENAETLGIGVTVTDNGHVYAVVDLC